MRRESATDVLESPPAATDVRESIRRCAAVASCLLVVLGTGIVLAQEPSPATREEAIVARQREKAAGLRPYQPHRIEAIFNRVEDVLASGPRSLHLFFGSAYQGGSMTLGAGWRRFVSPYSAIDVRGSLTVRGYKRAEAEFIAPMLFGRRGTLSVLGGWREATQVGFYGFGTQSTSRDDRTNYGFTQPHASATLSVRPHRLPLVARGGFEITRWTPGPGSGSAPSIETVYTEATVPGLNARPTYLHSQAALGLDTRLSSLYARRGSYLGVTFHDYADTDDEYSFRTLEYQAVQHVPIGPDAWVLSLRADVTTTAAADGSEVPYFMMPALGGGHTLRGFSSFRFRDRHTLLVGAEWRVLANRFLDMALFYDAGKAVSSTRHLDLQGLKSDYGVGFRFHAPQNTALRVEVAHSNEGLKLVFATSAVF